MDKITILPTSYIQRTGSNQAKLQLFLVLENNFTSSEYKRKIHLQVNNKIVECFIIPKNKKNVDLTIDISIKKNQKRVAVQIQGNAQAIKSDLYNIFIKETKTISAISKPDLHDNIKNIISYVDSLNIEGYQSTLLLREKALIFLNMLDIDDQREEYIANINTVNLYQEYQEEIVSKMIKEEQIHNLVNFREELRIVIIKKYNPWEPIEWVLRPKPLSKEERKARGRPGVSDSDYGYLVL